VCDWTPLTNYSCIFVVLDLSGVKISQTFVNGKIILAMVAFINKWLFAAVLPLFLSSGPGLHPLHMTVTQIDHNATDKTLEISCKIFTDDFENILEKTYKTNIDLINPSDRAAVQKLIVDYVQKRLALKVDGKAAQLNCIGFERDHEATFSYFQVDNISAVKSVDINCSLLYDLFDDETNIIHITIGGKRKSTKLNYPQKEAIESFSN